MKNTGGTKAKWLIAIVVAVMLVFLLLIGFLTDFLWFKELDYVSVFLTKLITQLTIGVPTFIVILLASYAYMKALKRGYFKNIESQEPVDEKRLNRLTWAMAAVTGFALSLIAVSALWYKFLQFKNSTAFNIADPLFGHDIAFYIFQLDFIKQINEIIIAVVIALALVTVLYYMVLLSMRTPQMFEEVPPEFDDFDPRGRQPENPFEGTPLGDLFNQMNKSRRPRRAQKRFDDDNFMSLISIATKQLIVLGVIFFLMIGVNFFLKQYDLLYSGTGVLYGAGFTDINITLWVYRILAGLSVLAAIMFAIGISKKNFRTILAVPVVMIAISLLGSGGGLLVQNLVVSPDEINKEYQYLQRNIEYTQYAYGLDNVLETDFAASNTLTKEVLDRNEDTIKNIRINDYEPTEKFYNQTQSIRQYYTFNDVDVDRYMINGEYTQTFLSAREIDETRISQEWLNKHLKYTHGYGITLSRVDQITPSGQPDMLIDSIPPISQVDEIQIDRPEIYFGELTNSYILVGTNEEEFDYPDGSSNRYSMYEGDAGIDMNMLNRLMFSIRERSLKLMVSTNITSDSRIIINRNIMERVNEIMPYLTYDNNPYIVTVDGKLYWMLDAYTMSSNYPYSEPYENQYGTNYIRNSVKVVIDAYNGTTNYYVVDESDPMALTMQKIFPDLFKDFEEMPDSLKAHIRYPNALFEIQANVYARYHMEDINVFYQNEDRWEISNEIYGTKEQRMTPNYYIMKLPGQEKAEFINTIPYTPKDKKNLIALLVARNDGEHYGELVVYQLPKSKIVYGPMQIEAQIDQSTEISKEFSLWNSSGSTYTRGNMFVIPIEDSLLYVEPVYLEATNSSIPEVKRVIVAYNDRIAYEATLAEALQSLFGTSAGSGSSGGAGETPTAPGEGGFTQAELVQLANEALANAQAAQQSGNWARYGEYLRELENYLNLLAN